MSGRLIHNLHHVVRHLRECQRLANVIVPQLEPSEDRPLFVFDEVPVDLRMQWQLAVITATGSISEALARMPGDPLFSGILFCFDHNAFGFNTIDAVSNESSMDPLFVPPNDCYYEDLEQHGHSHWDCGEGISMWHAHVSSISQAGWNSDTHHVVENQEIILQWYHSVMPLHADIERATVLARMSLR